MKISFYLKLSDTAKNKLSKEPELKDDKNFTVPIYYYLFVNGKHLRASTNINVSICQWDEDKKKVNRKHLKYPELNDKLDKIRLKIENGIEYAKSKNLNITNDFISNWLNGKDTKESENFIKAYNEYLNLSKFAKNTLISKRVVLKKLVDFFENEDTELTFNAINLKFYDKFVKFLENNGIINNSISHYISTLKAFMNYAINRDLHNNREFQKKMFNVKNEPTEIISLSKEEFFQFFECDLSKHKKLEEVRDAFFFSCVTGLRISDLSNLKKEAINNNMINVNTIKTNCDIQIPMTNMAQKIIDKYKDKTEEHAFSVKKNPELYIYLRRAAKEAGLDRMILKVRYCGAERKPKNIPLHEAITFHLAKKTFVSLLIESGISREQICDITGNTYETIGRYVNTNKAKSREDVKNAINNICSDVQPNEMILKTTKTLLKNKVDLKVIAEVTGLTIETIKKYSF